MITVHPLKCPGNAFDLWDIEAVPSEAERELQLELKAHGLVSHEFVDGGL